MPKMIEVPQESADNYTRILAILGADAGTDPVAEVERMSRALAGIPRQAIANGWTARALSNYASGLRLALQRIASHPPTRPNGYLECRQFASAAAATIDPPR